MTADKVARFATYVATLGRGPGRSRALTRDEAADAMSLLLAGAPAPEQVGAFLMLLRYRGEDAAEIAGLVEGARTCIGLPGLNVALDWPSYGAGRTRGTPWFLLSALALGQAGWPVLMHGSNAFSGGMDVADALGQLGLAAAPDAETASFHLERRGFAYVAIGALSAVFANLLGLRRLLGLRSPMNTVARLLNPADAPCSVDGVFHPPYIDLHLDAASLLGRQRLLVLKGGGGEAERSPGKASAVHLYVAGAGRSIFDLPALTNAPAQTPEPPIEAIWRGTHDDPAIEARIVGTIALGLMALGQGGDVQAADVWKQRRKEIGEAAGPRPAIRCHPK
jgi:anthranilate phosphoribosyltransferase